MFCRQCGSELKEGAAFCSKCGYKVVNQADEKIEISPPVIGTVCSKCGAPLKEGAAFCNACGASTAPAVEMPGQAAVSLENSTPKVSSLCSKCGAPLKEDTAFCNACGASTAPAVETPVQAAVSLEKSTPKVSSLCGKCGVPLKEGAAFCNACGASVIVQQPVQQAPTGTIVNNSVFDKTPDTVNGIKGFLTNDNDHDEEKSFSASDIPGAIIAVIMLFVTHMIMKSNGSSIISNLYGAFWLWFLLMSIANIPCSLITLIYHAVKSNGKGIKNDLIGMFVSSPIGIMISLISLHSVAGCVIIIVVTMIIGGIIYLIKHLRSSD